MADINDFIRQTQGRADLSEDQKTWEIKAEADRLQTFIPSNQLTSEQKTSMNEKGIGHWGTNGWNGS